MSHDKDDSSVKWGHYDVRVSRVSRKLNWHKCPYEVITHSHSTPPGSQTPLIGTTWASFFYMSDDQNQSWWFKKPLIKWLCRLTIQVTSWLLEMQCSVCKSSQIFNIIFPSVFVVYPLTSCPFQFVLSKIYCQPGRSQIQTRQLGISFDFENFYNKGTCSNQNV